MLIIMISCHILTFDDKIISLSDKNSTAMLLVRIFKYKITPGVVRINVIVE